MFLPASRTPNSRNRRVIRSKYPPEASDYSGGTKIQPRAADLWGTRAERYRCQVVSELRAQSTKESKACDLRLPEGDAAKGNLWTVRVLKSVRIAAGFLFGSGPARPWLGQTLLRLHEPGPRLLEHPAGMESKERAQQRLAQLDLTRPEDLPKRRLLRPDSLRSLSVWLESGRSPDAVSCSMPT